VGRRAQGQFADTAIGDKVIMPDGQWPVVGVFTTGDIIESTFFADRDTVMTANRKNTYNSVLVRLTSPAAYETFRRAVTTNPALSVSVDRHSTWYERLTAQQSAFFTAVAYAVGIVMAIGAMFGALNTMYAAGRRPHPRNRHLAGSGLRLDRRGNIGNLRGVASGPDRSLDWRGHRLDLF